jgi:hypothetical protein
MCLFQGVPTIPTAFIGTTRMIELTRARDQIDPCVFCSAYQKDRFYIFSNRSPKDDGFSSPPFPLFLFRSVL